MGTSTAHRSPSTPEWEQVRELYLQRDAAPATIASRVTSALSASARAGLADAAIGVCLDTLLEAPRAASAEGLPALLERLGAPSGPPVLQMASALRTRAVSRIATADVASLFGELGLAALAHTAFDACGGAEGITTATVEEAEAALSSWADPSRLGGLAARFVGREMEQAYRYFVSRDLSDFVGLTSVPRVTDKTALVSGVGRYCQGVALAAAEPCFGPELARVAGLPEAGRVARLQPLLALAVGNALAALAAGG